MEKDKDATFDFNLAYWITVAVIIQLSFNFLTTLVLSAALNNLSHNTMINFQTGGWQAASRVTLLISFVYGIAAIVLTLLLISGFLAGREK